jgi:hypothetical protein
LWGAYGWKWVRKFRDGAIDAYIGIGMRATDYGQPMLEPFPLDGMKVPVLDVYGAGGVSGRDTHGF